MDDSTCAHPPTESESPPVIVPDTDRTSPIRQSLVTDTDGSIVTKSSGPNPKTDTDDPKVIASFTEAEPLSTAFARIETELPIRTVPRTDSSEATYICPSTPTRPLAAMSPATSSESARVSILRTDIADPAYSESVTEAEADRVATPEVEMDPQITSLEQDNMETRFVSPPTDSPWLMKSP